MSTTCCTFIKPDGAPCDAHALPDSEFCLFHDPAHAVALAEARSKGGSTPRRRVRRYPRRLDHLHVADLLSELFIDALNSPEPIDTPRLRALTHLAQLLLKTVGIPKDPPRVPADRREPADTADHPLRVYPPLTPDPAAFDQPEALLELCPAPPNVPSPEPASPAGSPIAAAPPVPHAVTPAAPPHSPSLAPQDQEHAAQQERNRFSTGSPAIRLSSVPWPANPPFDFLSIPGSRSEEYLRLHIRQEGIQVRSRAAQQDLNKT
jgi:hypothetical protein